MSTTSLSRRASAPGSAFHVPRDHRSANSDQCLTLGLTSFEFQSLACPGVSTAPVPDMDPGMTRMYASAPPVRLCASLDGWTLETSVERAENPVQSGPVRLSMVCHGSVRRRLWTLSGLFWTRYLLAMHCMIQSGIRSFISVSC